jgi:uncharacterized protein with GYD domain
MPKYLFQGSYTEQGLKGLLKEGGSGRLKAAEELVKSVGGKLEVCYWAFGGDDFVLVVDIPSNVDVAAASFTANASGAVKVQTTVLMTAEEVDQAVKKSVAYRPPGQ